MYAFFFPGNDLLKISSNNEKEKTSNMAIFWEIVGHLQGSKRPLFGPGAKRAREPLFRLFSEFSGEKPF